MREEEAPPRPMFGLSCLRMLFVQNDANVASTNTSSTAASAHKPSPGSQGLDDHRRQKIQVRLLIDCMVSGTLTVQRKKFMAT